MKFKRLFKISALSLAFLLIINVFSFKSSSVTSIQELKNQQSAATNLVNELKKKKADADKQKEAIEKQIAATQALINACNAKLNEYAAQIAGIEAQIKAKEDEINDTKELFKKRIRSIYMSNSKSSIQIIMGADSFSDYLTLAQMTKSVTVQDNSIVEDISEAMEEIKEEREKINVLYEEQKSIKTELSSQKSNLTSQENAINQTIKVTDADIKKAQDELKKIQSQLVSSDSGQSLKYDGGAFCWPTQGFYRISAGVNSNDSVHIGSHKGIDIAGGGISGTPVLAAASGTVYASNSSCTHNYKKTSSCGCGGGYGNYVAIDHGTNNGNHYKTLYGHMVRITVSKGQHVEKGQVIGYVGTTGWSTGPHLHFEFIVNGVYMDARNYY